MAVLYQNKKKNLEPKKEECESEGKLQKGPARGSLQKTGFNTRFRCREEENWDVWPKIERKKKTIRKERRGCREKQSSQEGS